MGVAGARGGAAQLDFPQRFDTCPVSVLALLVLYGIPAGESTLNLFSICLPFMFKLAFRRNPVPSIESREANCVIKGGKKPGVKAKLSGRAE